MKKLKLFCFFYSLIVIYIFVAQIYDFYEPYRNRANTNPFGDSAQSIFWLSQPHRAMGTFREPSFLITFFYPLVLLVIKSFKKNIEVFDTPSYFKDIHKYHQIIHETDLANNFGLYYKKYKKKLSKYMQDAIAKGSKHSAKEYAEAIDFIKRSYDSYEEVFEDYHGVLTPSSPGVAPKGLKSTGTAEFNKVWSYLGTPCISLPLLQGENEMPLGVQLVGARYDDHRFLGVANWLEKECNK